jgi:hypothetical protein
LRTINHNQKEVKDSSRAPGNFLGFVRAAKISGNPLELFSWSKRESRKIFSEGLGGHQESYFGIAGLICSQGIKPIIKRHGYASVAKNDID